MVQFITNAGHFQSVYDLGVGRALRVCIDGCEVIWFLNTRASIDRDGVEELFPWSFHGLGRAGVAGSATSHFRHLVLVVLVELFSYNEINYITI